MARLHTRPALVNKKNSQTGNLVYFIYMRQANSWCLWYWDDFHQRNEGKFDMLVLNISEPLLFDLGLQVSCQDGTCVNQVLSLDPIFVDVEKFQRLLVLHLHEVGT